MFRSLVIASCVSIFTLALATKAHAQGVFRPLEFKDPELNRRADIKDILAGLPVPLSRLPVDLHRTEIDVAYLTFFRETGEFLERAAEASPRVRATPIAPGEGCADHEGFPTERIPAPTPACSAVYRSTVWPAFLGFQKSCRYVYSAERFVEEQRPGAVSLAQVSNLEGLMSLAGEALSHLDFPGALETPEFHRTLREAIAKIRTDKLVQGIRDRQRAYRSVLNLVASRPTCFNASAAELSEFSASVRRLGAELDVAKSYLDRLNREGLQQAARDRQALTRLGRTRGTLPYPSLTDEERQLLTRFLGGVYWRMRGGGLIAEPEGTQATRFYYTYMPMSVLGALNGGDVGRKAGQALYYALFTSWSQWQDMGRNNDDLPHDLVYMTQRGRTQVFGSATLLQDNGYDPRALVIGGMQMGPCYAFAWDKLAGFRIGAELRSPYAPFLEGPTAWGELCTGQTISLGLSKALLFGVRR